jgi:acetoin utilization deacetylase AcuC-like enzyme
VSPGSAVPVAVFAHHDPLLHNAGPGHPEAPGRLDAVLARLAGDPAAAIQVPPRADREAMLAVHPAEHLLMLEGLSRRGGGAIDADTVLNESSWPAAMAAAGATIAAVRHAVGGKGNAFAATRPPGHHASAVHAMGFCLLNNVVIGAREAQRLGAPRVLIVDWDVHHGNGTQALVEQDETIRFVSLHQSPWWPGTGAASERGVGNVFNVPRPPGLPPERYVEDLWSAVAEATTGWTPDIVLISAGFDAMRGDPLGGFTLEPEHYATLTGRLRDRLAPAPLVGVMEGGYIPSRLADGVAAHVHALS